jgi:hypothetical protein
MKEYLGDGVYVDFRQRQLVLTAENGHEVLHEIFLEDYVYKRLLEYVEDLKNQIKQEKIEGFPSCGESKQS